MSTLDERTAYERNPYFTGHIYGNFSSFYVTIAICTILLGSIIIINIVFGCCSKYRSYWQDRHTGNRWLISIWSATPHKQPPLDYTELKDALYFQSLQVTPQIFNEDIEATPDITSHQQLLPQYSTTFQQTQRPQRVEQSISLHHQLSRDTYLSVPKRESEI